MDFYSLPFVSVFMPLFIIVYLLAPLSYRFTVLFLTSVVFITAGQPAAIPWLLALTLIGYASGRMAGKKPAVGKGASFWTRTGIGLNVGILLAVKLIVTYKTRMISFGGVRLDEFVLPLGLSYLTFQIIAYLVDVSQGVIPAEKNMLRFVTYTLFFPKLAAGPITKYQVFSSQVGSLITSEKKVISGLGRILTGAMKHFFIAKQLGIFANAVLNRPNADMEPTLAWLALIASVFQLYFDFSGYTDIALGFGKMIGIDLPENFNYPFISQSINEFWRRWHMTLIAWFREYVFYPIERRRLRFAGQQINLLIVFILTGLWHGPTLNFLCWGLLQGMAVVFESTAAGKWWLRSASRPIRHFYSIFIVLFSWVFFRSPSLSFALEWVGRLAGNRTGLNALAANRPMFQPIVKPFLLFVILIALILSLPVKKRFQAWFENSGAVRRFIISISQRPMILTLKGLVWERKRWWLIPMALVLVLFGLMTLILQASPSTQFMYAGF
jgi:alginate O-acetyltransferase complex protein AlgI